jgi:tetratricopeptide (TPR) repeat protein
MFRFTRVLALLWVGASVILAAEQGHQHGSRPEGAAKGPQLLPNLGSYHHPIATQSPQAQRWFDQGLTLIYGFNHDEAIRSFEQAAKLDPAAVMPLWGISYALGPNINLPVDPEAEKKAFAAVQKALAMSAKAPPHERAYVEALAKRYSDDSGADLSQLAKDYAAAMKNVMESYPDDPDAATLYAESLMDLNPWKLYDLDGNPVQGTEEIVSVLESVLKRYPNHPGANHYYIHAVEASRNPERALPSAQRLQTLVPGAGHLVHMPSHIYARTGDYSAAAKSNAQAAQVDRDTMKLTGITQGIYPLMYYGHNLHFLAYAASMDGRYDEAKKAADQVAALVVPVLQQMSMAEFVLPTPLWVDLRFQKWDSILKSPEPAAGTPTTRGMWHFFRGMALASQGKAEQAQAEKSALDVSVSQVPADTPYSGTGLATSGMILAVAAHVLDARISSALGQSDAAVSAWEKAVKGQDKIPYDEPPAWLYPIRESLGGELLRAGRYEEAEKVFRADLSDHPRNPRSLLGLAESLKGQKKLEDAAWVTSQFKSAWKGATLPTAASL